MPLEEDGTKLRWDSVYRKLGEGYARYRPNDQLVESLRRHLSDTPKPRVLEVGVGKGNESLVIAAAGAAVVGLDYSRAALALLDRRSSGQGSTLELVEADARVLPFQDGAFDLVFSQGVLEHFRDPTSALREQRRVLRPGGVIVVEVPNKFTAYTVAKRLLMWVGRWAPGWETEYSPRQLHRLLSGAGFDVIDTRGWDFLLLRAIRKIRRRLGFTDSPPLRVATAIRRRLETNPLVVNVCLSLVMAARKPG